MKKFYSLVLMATMLLIGTNAWADGVIEIVRGGVVQGTYDNLKDAFVAAQDGDILQLTGDINESPSEAAWFGAPSSGTPETYANPDPENPQNGYRAVTLDLKGHTYTFSGNPRGSSEFVCIAFTRGKLTIKSTGGKGEIKSTTNNVELIRVYGTYHKIDAKEETPFTHLVVEENVKLTSDQLNAITIEVPQKEQATSQWNRNYPLDYSCHFSPIAQQGVSNGVRLDIKGELTGKKYGLKPSGNIRIGREFYEKDEVNGGYKLWDEGKVFKSGEYAYVFTMVYDEKNTTTHECYKPGTTRTNQVNYVNAHSLVKPEGATKGWAYSYVNTYEEGGGYEWGYNDSIYSPYIHIYPSARLVANNPGSGKAAGYYAAGYARCLIEGYCEGSTGVYVKSGDVELHDATVKSNWETNYYTPQPGTTVAAIDAGGSAIVIDSNEGWTGSISVEIGGDTKVSTDHGYAIDERITNNDGTNVNYLTITGGTFQGGQIGQTGDVPIYGSVYISQPTLDANSSETEITTINVLGANITSTDNKIGDGENQTTLADFLSGQGNNTHITYVEDELGKTTMVISEGDAPAEDPDNVGNTTWAFIASQSNSANPPSYAWTAQESDAEIASGTIYLGELQIISGDADHKQILTIKDGACLDVQHLIMNDFAQIIVKAGGKLIVEGTQGIVAKKDINIKLESSEAKQATFLFNPKVSSNKYPKATVDMTVAKGVDEDGDVWTRFAIPVRHMPETGWIKKNNATTWLYGWDYEANEGKGAWATVTNGTVTGNRAMKPWTGYTLSNNLGSAEVYTFKDSLVGNVNAELKFVHEGYNYFGNSYSSHIDAKTLLQGLTDSHVDGAIYMWSVANQAYTSTSLYALNKGDISDWQKDVAPMQTFILQLRGANSATQSVNYDAAVWSNPRHGHNVVPANNAPRRQMAENNDDAYINMVVTAANGKSDRILFFENAANSDAYENGYDASKYMNENTINFYATVNGENLSNVVTDNLEGKLVTLQTNEDVTYTISFKTVEGNEYVLRDNVTGAEVAIFAGNTYEFAAQPNSVIEGRFEIIKAAKMPTAIENTEVKANVKGIYTLTGQYLGEDFSVLPAGVYVVNGVKIVK